MTFRTKLIAVALLPVILISLAVLLLIDAQSRNLAKSQGQVVEQMIRDSKRAELQNYLKLARAAVEPFYQWDYVSRLQAQKQVADVITNMTFGEDGYFFVSRSNGRPLENPLLLELDGQEKFGPYGKEIALLSKGTIQSNIHGTEFFQYDWKKPSTGKTEPKIAMSAHLPNWDWIIASGLYTDDISEQIGQVQTQLQENVQQTRWVVLAMAAGAIALTSLLLTFVRFSEQKFADARLKQLASELVDAQENERKRVSTELHDGISQLLVSARYALDLAGENSKSNPKIYEPVEKSMNAISTAISEIRRISMALRPSVLDDMGLAAALKSLGKDFENQTAIKTDVSVQNVGNALDDRAKTTLYRVAQETLTNVAKHANAQNVIIDLNKTSKGVSLEISDNGVGLSSHTKGTQSSGMGLRNIKERLESHGGRFIISAKNDKSTSGTSIDVFIPTPQK